jgi:hypothetical protein
MVGKLRRIKTLTYNERRAARRLKTRLRVDYCALVKGMQCGGFRRGVSGDLSPSGIFLSDTGYLPVGATLQLLIRLPDIPANPIACYGRIVRADREHYDGYGITFMRMRAADRRRMERYIGAIEDAKGQAIMA